MSKVNSILRREERSILISTAALWLLTRLLLSRPDVKAMEALCMLECVWCLAGGWSPSGFEACPGRQMLFGQTMNDTQLSWWCQCWRCYNRSVRLMNYERMSFQANGVNYERMEKTDVKCPSCFCLLYCWHWGWSLLSVVCMCRKLFSFSR